MSEKLYIKKYNLEGDITWEYNPLRIKLTKDKKIEDFNTNELQFDISHPVDIECQQSYDGTINLIINDDLNPPMIINSRFTKIEDNRYQVKTRNQYKQTNLYQEGSINAETRLFRNINKIPKIKLYNIYHYGQLMGGNYTFYMKYGDSDYNKTDIVAESGIISIFNGSLYDITTISGTLSDQRTDKVINLDIYNIDTSFAYIYLYFRRDTSDTNGVHSSKTYLLKKPYKIKGDILNISVNGYEEIEEIDQEELNIKYNICTAVKTQAQVQNMLFFGNIQQTIVNNVDLQNISYYIEVSCKQRESSIGYITEDYVKQASDDIGQTEYYNPLNIYYSLGYWPDELYRLGIVYIFNDDSLTPVYNLRGCKLDVLDTPNFTYNFSTPENIENFNDSYSRLYKWKKENNEAQLTQEFNYLPKEPFIGTKYLDNTKGVFWIPNVTLYKEKSTNPLYFEFSLSDEVISALKSLKIKGFFFVRQKRIPITLAQGLSVGIDPVSYCPMLKVDNKYIYESFLDKNKILSTTYNERLNTTDISQSSGLLCLDAIVNKQLQSLFDNSKFLLLDTGSSNSKVTYKSINSRYYYSKNEQINNINSNVSKVNCIYIATDLPLKYINSYGYSTRVGSAEDAKQIGFIGNKDFNEEQTNFVRGIFCPFIGTQAKLNDSHIYSIKLGNYDPTFMEQYFESRGNDLSPFMTISDRYSLENDSEIISSIRDSHTMFTISSIYRGDCFTCTVTMRLHTNFIDPETPTNQVIVDPNTWKDNYKGYDKMSTDNWGEINRADINSVQIGTWITYKCMSNYNLGLRAEDRSNLEEINLLGNTRSFYPLTGLITAPSGRIPESELLNDGYNVTLPFKRYFEAPDVPYIKDIFDTRIMFSDVQVEDNFRNSYRIFQGLDYKDVERQYGGIVKLLTLGTNLFCVFEHGCAIIPINEKALLSTNTGQSIHMYGAGVIQNQVTPISPDYGSIWEDSIIRTPNGIYGVDTNAKKIWRYNSAEGFKIISDMTMQRFLNDNIQLSELDKYPVIALKNVKSHFNNFKGDVMFTFYNRDKVWNICYNERLQKWITKYTWTPLLSENYDNIFFSLDRERAKLLSIIWQNQNTDRGLTVLDHNISDSSIANGYLKCGNIWNDISSNYEAILRVNGYNFNDYELITINSITTSEIDRNTGEEIFKTWTLKEGLKQIPNETDVNQYTSSITYKLDNNETSNNDIRIEKVGTNEKNNPYDIKITINKDSILNRYFYLIFNLSVKLYTNITINTEKTSTYQVESTLSAYFNSDFAVLKRTPENQIEKTKYGELISNGFYVHGQAGIFDEINNIDLNQSNNTTPTKWYNKQEPFEFEFIVNNPNGLHKIFNNLVIISNNVEPQSLEFEIVGDIYDFDKEGIYKYTTHNSMNRPNMYFPTINLEKSGEKTYSTEVIWDNVLNQYSLKTHQDCMNIETYGRRLGNIHYSEDKWNIVIQPIYYSYKDNIWRNTRLRDKYAKIRVKYSGEKLAVITAIHTLISLSYA